MTEKIFIIEGQLQYGVSIYLGKFMKKFILRKGQVRIPGIIILAVASLTLASCGRQQVYSVTLPPQESPRESAPMQSCPPSTGALVVEKQLTSLSSAGNITHAVGPLETLWRISKMYDIPIQEICAANNLKPEDTLRIGQKLIVPNASNMRHVIALYPNSRWQYIIIHHTATDIGNACLINRSHHDRGFWDGLGYHFLIDNGTLGKSDGQIEEAPRWIKQQSGAHCKAYGMNEKGIGIALVGNFDVDLPTQEQLKSLSYLVNALCRYYQIKPCNVIGHRDVEGAATDCPGLRFPWSCVRQCLAAYEGSH
jgi:N-acetylmuramoyl-L-alanine amidase